MRSLLVIAALALIVAAAWLETQAGLAWYDLTVFGMVTKVSLFASAMGLYVIFAVWRASLR